MAFCSCLHSVKFLAFAFTLNEESVGGKHKFAAGATWATGATRMDRILEIFGVTRGRPEVNHEFRKYYGLLLTLLPKQPLGTPTRLQQLTFPPSHHWLSIAPGETRTPGYTFQMTYLIVGLHTLYPLQCWRTEQLHKFPGGKQKRFVFAKDRTNNVASLLTYRSIC